MSPLRYRARQLEGISRAVELIDPDRRYPYEFVCFQVTGYRPRRPSGSMFDGRILIEELAELARSLSAANPLLAGRAPGPLYDAQALATRLKVSRKTIFRWRKRGLLGQWYRFGDGLPRLAFSARAVQRFVSRNLELVRRGAAYRTIDREEKEKLIARARELVAMQSVTLGIAATRLAAESGRTVETLRAVLRRFDRENPNQALFDSIERPQAIDGNDVIYDAFAKGESLAALADRFERCESEIRRILTRVRSRRLAAEPISYMYNPLFDAPDAEQAILASTTGSACEDGDGTEKDVTLARVPGDLPAYLKALYRVPLLTKDEEQHLFRQMNYLFHKAELLRQKATASPESATAAGIAAVEAALDRARLVKNRLIQANLRLVVSIAKRHLNGQPLMDLFELVSDGNIALMRAVEKFDYAKGFKFSTYATWAIVRGYARSIPAEQTQAERFRTGSEEVLVHFGDDADSVAVFDDSHEHIRGTIADCLADLSDRERSILEQHYGLGAARERRTLQEIGRERGITKERVRQIEMRALGKLRAALEGREPELLAG